MTIDELAMLLATSPMPENEREMWLELLPKLPQALVAELGAALKKQHDSLDRLRAGYTEKIEKMVAQAQTDTLKAA